MDIRISFRVRERKDVELILGQGMLAAGWHAHTLNAPGKFLISAPEHDTPRRARAYLLTDETVTDTAASHARLRPALDEISRQAVIERETAESQRPGHEPADRPPGGADDEADDDGPQAILRAALSLAPEDGSSVPDLMMATGMSRATLYRHLAEHARTGQALQVSRGRWRACATQERDPQ
jgi:hypothetical protein